MFYVFSFLSLFVRISSETLIMRGVPTYTHARYRVVWDAHIYIHYVRTRAREINIPLAHEPVMRGYVYRTRIIISHYYIGMYARYKGFVYGNKLYTRRQT